MKNKFKFLVTGIFIITLCVFNSSVYSQSLQFCEDVSDNGAPVNVSTVFNIDSKGGYLKCLTTLPYKLGTDGVSYEVYKVDSEGNESYDNTIYQDVDATWTWFWKEITFYDTGRYNIYVYDNDKNFLASAQIRIQYY